MNAITLVLSAGIGVLLAGSARRVAALEAKVDRLEKRNDDLALKGRIVSSQVFGSPLQNFFASDEFWQNTYDSGQADCAKRCIATLTAERKACEDIVDPTQRQKCFQDAVDRASSCQTRCSASNPPPLL
jgi:hypothetical protein